MKNSLHNLISALLIAVLPIYAFGQHARITKPASSIKPTAARDFSVFPSIPTANKNGNSVLFPFVLSGYYAEGFEGAFPPTGWQVIDILDPTYTWIQSNVLPFEGLNSAYVQYSNMGIDGEDMLIMPQFSCLATDSLTFWLKPEYVLYPPDTTFIVVSTTDSLPSSFTTVVATLAEGLNYPVTTNFEYYSYSLSAFAGQDIYVAFLNKNTYGDGIFIDKVDIGTKPAANAAAFSIDLPSYVPAGVMNPLATVLNAGSATQTFDVTMTITGGYSSTKTVTNLIGGATQQVTFDPWTAVAGTVTVNIQTLLIGDSDPSNDTLSTSVIVVEPFENYGWVSKPAVTAGTFGLAGAFNLAGSSTNSPGNIYSIGGADFTAVQPVMNDFSTSLNSWSTASPMTTEKYQVSAQRVGNFIYVAGGYSAGFVPDLNTYIYDIAGSLWSNGAAMPTPVGDYASGIYADSLIYYIGGYDGAGDVNTVSIYNTIANTWSTGTAKPGTAVAGLRGGIYGDKIVIAGGYSQTLGTEISDAYIGTIDQVDPSIITWAPLPAYPGGTAGRLAGGVAFNQFRPLVYFVGGDPTGAGTAVLSDCWGYDLLDNEWKIGPAKITGVSNISNFIGLVYNDSLWMASVAGYDGINISTVNEWLNLGASPPLGINETNGVISFTNSPNPFNKFTFINFSIEQTADVKVVISDMVGNEISVLCDHKMNAGAQQLKWDAEHISAGMYLCTIMINGESSTYKLIKN